MIEFLRRMGDLGKSEKEKPSITTKRWTEDEDVVLISFWGTDPDKALKILKQKGRTERAIAARLTRLNNKGYSLIKPNKRWTKEEDQIIIDLWGSDREKVVELLGPKGRSRKRITDRASILRSLGAEIPSNSKKWTEEEDQLIVRQWGKDNAKVLGILDRTSTAIHSRVSKLRKEGKL